MKNTNQKRSGYATPREAIQMAIGCILLTFVPIFTFLFSYKYYKLEDGNNPILFKIIIVSYLLSFVLLLLVRKKLFASSFFFSLFFAIFIDASFDFLNGFLDHTTSIVKDYTITDKFMEAGGGRSGPTHVFKIKNDTEQKTVLDLPPDLYNKGRIGDPFQRLIGEGFFDQPWVKDQKIP